MAMLTLRTRNSGALFSVQLATITTVSAHAVNPASIGDGTNSAAGDSPVYLSIGFTGEPTVTRFVTVDRDGKEDKSITDADEAIRLFTAAAQQAERAARR